MVNLFAARPDLADPRLSLAAAFGVGSRAVGRCDALFFAGMTAGVAAAAQEEGGGGRRALQHASEALRADRYVVLAALRQDGSALAHAS